MNPPDEWTWLTEGSRSELERLARRLADAGIPARVRPAPCTTGACSIDSELVVAPADLPRALAIVLAR